MSRGNGWGRVTLDKNWLSPHGGWVLYFDFVCLYLPKRQSENLQGVEHMCNGRDGEGKWWDKPDPDFNEDNWG